MPRLMVQLHAAQAMSEFQGYTGDCVENGLLMGLHALWPWRWALTASALNQLTQQAIASYGAGPRGQWDVGGMTRWLTDHGYRVRNVDPNAVVWPSELKRYGGILPCVVGVTNAQALPGNEPGVHNHGIALFGVYDDGSYSCGNGDATLSNPNALQRYTDNDLANAAISSITWIEGPMLLASDPDFSTYFQPITLADKSTAWLCKQTGKVISHAMLDYYQYAPSPAGNGGLGVLGLPQDDEYAAGPTVNGVTPMYQDFELGRLLYDPHRAVDQRPGNGWGLVFPTHVRMAPVIDTAGILHDVAAAEAALGDIKSKVGG